MDVIAGQTKFAFRLGEYRIALKPPDVRDRFSVRPHLRYAEILARWLPSSFSEASNGNCEIFAHARPLFPDLRGHLTAARPGRFETDQPACMAALKEVLRLAEPNPDALRQAAEAAGRERTEFEGLDFERGLMTAVTAIYPEGSLIPDLALEVLSPIERFDPQDFLDWLSDQRSLLSPMAELTRLKQCRDDYRDGFIWAVPASALSPRSVAPPGKLVVHAPSPLRAAPGRSFYLVVVGLAPATVERSTAQGKLISTASRKFCAFSGGLTLKSGTLIKTACRFPFFTMPIESWFAFFCLPESCPRDEDAAAAAELIAADPDIVALAERDSRDGPPRGPYVVEIRPDR